MKKKDETRYFVTAVASVPVYKFASKTEMYRMATKPGWGAVEWYSAADGYKNPVARDRSDKTQQLCCDEDTSASLYTKNGGYFGIFPYEEINVKEMPKQAACAAIIYSDSCGYSIWAEDFNQIHIFVTYDANGLIDSYRLEYGEDAQPYDGETEIRFEDLYQQPEGDWKETYRAEIPGTVEYQYKQEAARLAETAGVPWRDLPERFGPWQSVYSRFRAWTKAGVWEDILTALIEQDLVEETKRMLKLWKEVYSDMPHYPTKILQ